MFDFSTELILNELTGVSVLTDAQDPGLKTGDSALLIKKHGKFPKSYVAKAYKNAGYLPVNEIAEVDLVALTAPDLLALKGKVIRLSLDSRLSGSADGSYSRWAINLGRPTYAEFLVVNTYATPAALVTDLVTSYNKQLGPYADVTLSASTTKLIITAKNEYFRLDGVALEQITDAANGEVDIVILKTGTVTTKGLEGFGTTWFITKNLRLPTIENTRFMGITLDERPIANSIYDQYTFDMQVLRNITGQGAVGQLMTSKTTHVFYVLRSQAAGFEALITSAFGAGSLVNAKTGAAIN